MGISAESARRYSAALFEQMREIPDEKVPLPPPVLDAALRNRLKKLQQANKKLADQYQMSPHLIGNKQALETLLRYHLDGASERPAMLEDWRAEPFARSLLAFLNGDDTSPSSDAKGEPQ